MWLTLLVLMVAVAQCAGVAWVCTAVQHDLATAYRLQLYMLDEIQYVREAVAALQRAPAPPTSEPVVEQEVTHA